jgi:hypothetical protein
MTVSGKQIVRLVFSVLFLTVVVGSALFLPSVYASTPNQLTNRSLTLSSSSPAATNATTTYTFDFTVYTSTTPIKSIGIQLCTTADVDIGGTCTAPTGFTNASAALASQPTGLGAASGWTIDGSPPDTNLLRISNAANSSNPSTTTSRVVFSNVQNPTTTNQTFFARITTYSDAAWTTAVDAGTVAASTATLIQLTGTMPESLIFCTGATVDSTCTTTTPGNITFNQLFSPTTPAFATSQMAASTNAGSGYAITVSGATMTSGSNTVTAIGATPAVSTPGTRQFGLNLAANSGAETGDPNITSSAYVAPAADGGDYMGSATANFNIGDPSITSTAQQSKFAFDATGLNIVARSDNGANLGYTGNTPGPTNSQVFTASYLVNVSGNLPAGTYTTTLTYICTPTF